MAERYSLRGLKPPSKAAIALISVFGKREAEMAAIEIVEIARQRRSWDFEVTAADLSTDAMVQRGFECLCEWGWLSRRHAVRFVLTPKFISRVTSDAALYQDSINPFTVKAIIDARQNRSQNSERG